MYLDEDYVDDDYDADVPIDIDEVPASYKEMYGNPEVVGRNYELDIEFILQYPDEYEYVLSWLSNDDFPLKKEYLASENIC